MINERVVVGMGHNANMRNNALESIKAIIEDFI
jgi:hypothetical protein